MSEMNLRIMIEAASRYAEEIFRRTGAVDPIYHAIREDDTHLIIPAPDTDKDTGVAMVKAFFAKEKVTAYAFANEAWRLDARDGVTPEELERASRVGLKDHPNRREVVMLVAENAQGEMLTGTRYILRPEHGKPTLSPLKVDDMTGVESEGRMVGLLGKGR